MGPAALIERHRGGIRAFLAMAPFLIGFYPLTGLINPLWSSAMGFPVHLAARGHGIAGPHPPTELLAFLLWPLVVFAAAVWLSGKLLDWESRWRVPLVLVWSASAFLVVPFNSAATFFPGWPIWCAC